MSHTLRRRLRIPCVYLFLCAVRGQLGPLYSHPTAFEARHKAVIPPSIHELRGIPKSAWEDLQCTHRHIADGPTRGFWVGQYQPQNSIEAFVEAVVHTHRKRLPEELQRMNIFAEYWAKRSNKQSSVCALHTDRDEQLDELVTAHLSVITYLGGGVEPTVILPLMRCMDDPPYESHTVRKSGSQVYLVKPKFGKQLVFDPRYLHGICGSGTHTPSKERKLLIVNLWAGHRPLTSDPLGTTGSCGGGALQAHTLEEQQTRNVSVADHVLNQTFAKLEDGVLLAADVGSRPTLQDCQVEDEDHPQIRRLVQLFLPWIRATVS